jgi:hypothetical protein
MSISVNSSFVKQYEREVKEAFQRKTSKLINTVRRKPNVIGSTTTFQKIGKGVATTKSRHGLITPMNQSHTPVELTLSDFYAGDYVDKLDEAKINHDERRVISEGGASALNRKIDEQLVTELDATTNTVAAAASALAKGKIQSAVETLGDFDVFEEGKMWATLGWNAWNDMLNINEFAQAEYTGSMYPWLDGTEAKQWMGTMWVPSSVTNFVKSGSTFLSFLYHEDTIGYGSAPGITADITWVGERAAHFINHAMSGGAKLIDDQGVIEIQHV